MTYLGAIYTYHFSQSRLSLNISNKGKITDKLAQLSQSITIINEDFTRKLLRKLIVKKLWVRKTRNTLRGEWPGIELNRVQFRL